MIWQRFSSWPFADKRKLQSPLQFSAALRVLRGQMCCRCSSSWPFVVLRGQMCCRCSSSWPFVALRGQKEVAVAVAVLRGPPCPPWTNVLPLQFFVVLRGQKKLQSPLQFSAALRVLRGQMCCRCSSSWSFVGKRSCSRRCSSPRPSVSSVDKCAAVAVLRGPSWTKGSCSRRCSSSRPSVSSVDKCVAVAVLRGPSWTKGSCSRRCSSPRPSVSSVDKCAAVAVLRGPSWTKGSCSRRCSSSRPSVSSVDKCVAVAVLRGPSWPFVVLRGKRFPPLALRGQTKL